MSQTERPDVLYFVAARRPDGEPVEHLAGYGIPARDLTKGDRAYDQMTDEQVQLALDSKLYQKSKPTGAKAEAIAQATAPAAPPAEG